MANKVTIKPNASDLDLQATNNQVIVDGQTLDPNSVGVNITNQQLDLQTPPANEIVTPLKVPPLENVLFGTPMRSLLISTCLGSFKKSVKNT